MKTQYYKFGPGTITEITNNSLSNIDIEVRYSTIKDHAEIHNAENMKIIVDHEIPIGIKAMINVGCTVSVMISQYSMPVKIKLIGPRLKAVVVQSNKQMDAQRDAQSDTKTAQDLIMESWGAAAIIEDLQVKYNLCKHRKDSPKSRIDDAEKYASEAMELVKKYPDVGQFKF
jgi:hypothetical protein